MSYRRLSSSSQHEVEIEIGTSSFHRWILDGIDHLVEGRVGAEVRDDELDRAVLHVVTAVDVLHWQGDVQLGEGERLDVGDEGLLQLLLRDDQAVDVVVGLRSEDEGAEQRLLLHVVGLVLELPGFQLLLLYFRTEVVLLGDEGD